MTAAVIAEIEPGSLAEELGLKAGDKIISVNGKTLRDVIQFQFEWAGEEVELEIERDGESQIFEIDKDYDEPLGVVFDSAVFDRIKVCQNKCLFCFVDQMPFNMRQSLYVKDDDFRLSFLQGSFVTLTNLKKEDIERIKKEHLSPLYVSVHATNSELRTRLLKNPRAGQLLALMKDLARAGIEFHTQVVLCPGINDGQYLEQTYEDLLKIKGVRSLAIVPVGITKYRENLPELRLFTPREAREIIAWVHEKQRECQKKRHSNFIWLSDEFYLAAGEALPGYDTYEDFPQLENGVGMVRLFWHEFSELTLPEQVRPEKKITLVTGVSGRYVLDPLIEKLNQIKGLHLSLKVVSNEFFGPTVTVTGLLTGTCLLSGLKGLEPGTEVFLPSVMLKTQEGRFLDDLTPVDIEERLGVRITLVPIHAGALLEMIISR
jgi:putative radical SAM enzyme (TIGR03279 family)